MTALAAAPAQPGGQPGPGAGRLPPLREDLELLEGPREADGSPTWTVYDPIRHRYFRFGRAGFEFLARWRLGSGQALLEAIATETTLEATAEQLDQFLRFLASACLLRGDHPAALDNLNRQAAAAKVSWATWLLHHYLFIRVPLVRPDRFLAATLPFARLLLNRVFIAAVLIIGGLGIVLALRQWDSFAHTFLHFFTPEGALLFAVGLSLTKTCHELGHAYTAKHFGCRVPTMGAAFLVLWPVLYTDVTDSWRLVSRRARLLIGAAGILTELGLALIATLLWSFLPEGPARSLVFVIATTSWITTLAINLSPFMRFDAYYLLSDLLGVSNLQDRAFALTRWHLREILFGLDLPPPEIFPRRLERVLVIYSWICWIYRLVLFLGIAVLVYHVFVKVLGIFLFMVEITWFVARPMTNELKVWWRLRPLFRFNLNLLVTLTGLAMLGWLVVTPWQGQIAVPAVLRAADFATVFPPVPSRLAEIRIAPGQPVAAGAVLFVLEAPELLQKLELVRIRKDLFDLQIQRQAGSNEDRDRVAVLLENLAAALSAERGLRAQIARLTIRAPIAGQVTDLPPDLHVGQWLKVDEPLARIVDPSAAELRGYVEGAELDRIAAGASGRFLPEDVARPALAVRVTEVERVNAPVLALPYLASTNDGAIAVQRGPKGEPVPTLAVYRVGFVPAAPEPAPAQVIRGTVLVDGEARSLLGRAWRNAAGVLIRESGF